MKLFFVGLLLLPLFIACDQEESGTKITGMIDNLESGMFLLGGPGGARDSIMLNEDNSFEYNFLEIEEPGNYYLLSEKDYFPMYIAPGMQLDVYFDKSNFLESINFAGPGSDINNYKADKTRNFPRPDNDVYIKDPDAFRTWADSLLAVQQSLLNEQIKDDAEDPFWVQEEGDLIYTWALNLTNYPSYNRYYAKVKDVELTESFISYKDQLDINSSKYLNSTAFNNYVTSAVREAASALKDGQEDVNRNLLNLQTAAEIITIRMC